MDNQIFNQPTQTQTINLTNTPVQYSGFFRRFLAMLIDGFITGILGVILSFIVGSDVIITLSISTIIGVIYVGIFDSSEMMGTPGKAFMGIAVVSKSNLEKITFKTAVIRFVLKYVSGLMLCIGYLIQPFTEKKQAFHDMMAETVVIKKNIGEVNYFTAFKNNLSRVLNG
jgi:uncharacterized RDD family membrane protein YckC